MIKGAIRALLLLAILAPLGTPDSAAARPGSFAGTRVPRDTESAWALGVDPTWTESGQRPSAGAKREAVAVHRTDGVRGGPKE